MQHRHDDFGGWTSLLLVVVDRYPAPVVGDRNRLIRVDDDRDFGAISCQRLVNGIVDRLEHHVMKAGAIIGVANKHARPLSYGFKALQDLDVR